MLLYKISRKKEGKVMENIFLVNTILDRLPMCISGVSFNNGSAPLGVCLKLNKLLKR